MFVLVQNSKMYHMIFKNLVFTNEQNTKKNVTRPSMQRSLITWSPINYKNTFTCDKQ